VLFFPLGGPTTAWQVVIEPGIRSQAIGAWLVHERVKRILALKGKEGKDFASVAVTAWRWVPTLTVNSLAHSVSQKQVPQAATQTQVNSKT
jgi:hypothetical protein